MTLPPFIPRSYAYCSDSSYKESIISLIKDVDILYHEATFLQKDADKARDTYHCTAEQAAEIALKANVKKLLIGHFSARYKSIQLFMEEAKKIFENTCAVEDGEIYSVELRREDYNYL